MEKLKQHEATYSQMYNAWYVLFRDSNDDIAYKVFGKTKEQAEARAKPLAAVSDFVAAIKLLSREHEDQEDINESLTAGRQALQKAGIIQ